MRPDGAEFWTPRGIHALRDRLSAEQGHRCAYCGVSMLQQRGRKFGKRPLFEREVTIDEVVPRCEGGSRSWENTVAACRWCNQYRGNVPADLAFTRIQRLVNRGTHPHIVFTMQGHFPRLKRLRCIERPEAPT